MAAGRHNLTRRALLGAAAGVPLAVRDMYLLRVPLAEAEPSAAPDAEPHRGHVQVHVPTSPTRWSRALAAFHRAEARLAAFRRYEASLPAAARAFPACAPLEARSDALEQSRLDAIRRLLRVPAPDLPALARKIELAIDEEIAFFSGGDLCLAAVKADALRLCGGATPANSSG